MLLGGSVKIHRIFPPYLSLSIFIPFVSPFLFRHWDWLHYEGLYLTLWEEGDKGPEGKSIRRELKSNVETFEMLHPGIPEKVLKIFSVRKVDPQDNINTQGTS